MAKRTPCKRKIVEDALARNQERETGSIEEKGITVGKAVVPLQSKK